MASSLTEVLRHASPAPEEASATPAVTGLHIASESGEKGRGGRAWCVIAVGAGDPALALLLRRSFCFCCNWVFVRVEVPREADDALEDTNEE